ncbi:MAG: hypothetical protein FJ086_00605 [Deltaproteobacteria bacterium]|nr:hypothetical protein [Deltaproteobacteria bacterium]
MKPHLLLAALLLTACTPVLPAVDAGTPPSPLWSLKHAHNDYEHARPLLDALDQGFESVEADLWLDGEELGVSHTGAPFKGSLRALYLEPLAARIAANGGSVHGDRRPFYLWLDLKQGDAKLQELLASQLGTCDWLAAYDDLGEQRAGAVVVVLTGHDAAKKALAARPAPRPYVRDSNTYAPDDPPADGQWAFYAVNYFNFLAWDGTAPMPPTQRRQLQNLVDGVHQKGRALRIYASPDTPAYWGEARDAGVDFVNTDRLAELAAAFAP